MNKKNIIFLIISLTLKSNFLNSLIIEIEENSQISAQISYYDSITNAIKTREFTKSKKWNVSEDIILQTISYTVDDTSVTNVIRLDSIGKNALRLILEDKKIIKIIKNGYLILNNPKTIQSCCVIL